ncbi:LytR family transcriptional regulator [Occultella glacieicola]|uniref:LytR family transcriptional regulator n=1 Tax=Occultella glacieicola TaxID=2518684 RepID=A0ABY2E7M5_9MICO|nr:LCP family protein [Occultella glacieicola]TDE96162.1 LytR family transcriptional regulator [Occultella glacieicola]
MPATDMSSRPAHGRRRAPRHSRRVNRHQVLRGALLALIGIFAFAGTGAALTYNSLQGNIDQHDLSSILGEDRESPSPAQPGDPAEGRAYNLLVLGSDTRTGDNSEYGEAEGQRSDTTLVVHISADRSRVDVISIPRDLIVDIPSCPLPDGSETGESYDERFNAAFAYGGQSGDTAYAAACTILTVEEMTGLFIDDFVVVDMEGFKDMVNAIGGVDMCFEEDMVSPEANLNITAGCHTLDGETALAVARARKGIGNGSDIGRIDRQQELLTAMVEQVLAKNLLTDSAGLFQFLQAATASLSTSNGIGNITSMAGLAYSLNDVGIDNFTFATVPFDWSGNVVLQNADSEALWASVAADQPLVLPPDPDATDGTGTEDTSGATGEGQEEPGQG